MGNVRFEFDPEERSAYIFGSFDHVWEGLNHIRLEIETLEELQALYDALGAYLHTTEPGATEAEQLGVDEPTAPRYRVEQRDNGMPVWVEDSDSN